MPNIDDAIEQFRNAMQDCGLIPPQRIIGDGTLQRCATEGKAHGDDGCYILFLDGIPAGGMQNHRTGTGWMKWRANIGRRLTDAERASISAKAKAEQRQREADKWKRWQESASVCKAILAAAAPAADDHPYLKRKKVPAHPGLMLGYWKQYYKADCLLLPMVEGYGDKAVIWGVQAIFPEKDPLLNRDKDFLKGARKTGLHFLIGEIIEGATVHIAEGYSTGMSVHLATGAPVIVGFDAGNLSSITLPALPLAQEIVIAADNDESQAGLIGAKKAAEKFMKEGRTVRIAMPPETGTDFNDYYSGMSK